MGIIWELFAWLGPIAVAICLVVAWRETKFRRTPPPWLINSIMNMNGSDRKWGVK
jgi:hypothetical protein